MLSKISDKIQSYAKGWAVLATLAAFILLINLPIADPNLIRLSLDGQFAYSPEYAFSAVASYGEDGRSQMVWIHLADFILIILYTSMFCLSISWLFKRSFKPDSRMQRLNLVPLLGGFFDMMENIWILILLLAYPSQPNVAAWLSTIFTTSKYIMSIPIILLLMIGLVMGLMNRFKVKEEVTARE